MRLKPKSRSSQLVSLFRDSLPSEVSSDHLRSMRGNLNADTLLIAPPPTKEEFSAKFPLAGQAARLFHAVLLEQAKINTDEDFLIVSCSLTEAVNKAATLPMRAFVAACVDGHLFQRYVCVGSEAYRFLVGEGRKQPMPSVIGKILYSQVLNHRPLLVFPDIDSLAFSTDAKAYPDFRGYLSALHRRNNCLRNIRLIAGTLAERFRQDRNSA